VEGSCEHGNEPSGSIKCWELAAPQEGLSSMELVYLSSVTSSIRTNRMFRAFSRVAFSTDVTRDPFYGMSLPISRLVHSGIRFHSEPLLVFHVSIATRTYRIISHDCISVHVH
jgi:hypothetical protein